MTTQARTKNAPTKRPRDIQRNYPRAQFIQKLRRFADALEREETFLIQVAKEKVIVPASAMISVEHEREGTSEELEFQLTWKPVVAKSIGRQSAGTRGTTAKGRATRVAKKAPTRLASPAKKTAKPAATPAAKRATSRSAKSTTSLARNTAAATTPKNRAAAKAWKKTATRGWKGSSASNVTSVNTAKRAAKAPKRTTVTRGGAKRRAGR